jgi:magnesium chelatase family protein
MLARDRKIPHLLVPAGNAWEAAVVEGVAVYPVRTLTEVVEFVNGTRFIDPVRSENQPVTQESHRRHEDFRDVRGQYHAKRAIEVAMAGGHNMLTMWPTAASRSVPRAAAVIRLVAPKESGRKGHAPPSRGQGEFSFVACKFVR